MVLLVTTTMVVVVMIVTATIVVVLVIVGRLRRRRFHVGRRHRTHGRLFALSQFAFHVEIEVDLLHDEAVACCNHRVEEGGRTANLVANPDGGSRILHSR